MSNEVPQLKNNVDFAEAMIECVKQYVEKNILEPHKPLSWLDLIDALEDYKKSEEEEIQKLRKLKLK